MQLTIANRAYDLDRVAVGVGLHAAPTLRMRFRPGSEPPAAAGVLAAWCREGVEGRLDLPGAALAFVAAGFADRHAPGRPGQVERRYELTGLACPAGLPAWFGLRPVAAERMFISQRGRAEADPDGWHFFNRVTGRKFAPPPDAVTSAFDAALPPGAALVRRGERNGDWLDALIAMLGADVPAAAGWCAVCDATQPLRLVLSDALSIPMLDAGWEASGVWETGGLSSPAPHSGELTRVFRPERPGEMLAALATLGRAAGASELGGLDPADDAEQVVTLPGAVRLGRARLFCRRVEYELQETDDAPVVRARLRFGPPPARAVAPPRPASLPCEFDTWNSEDPVAARLKPAGGAWVMVSDRTGEPDGGERLLAELLTPCGTRGGRSAFHVKRTSGQVLRALVLPGEFPVVCGGPQRRDPEHEAHDFTLAGKTRVVGEFDVDETGG